MAKVIFYEKTGCRNNTKQKTLLTAAGHQVEAHNILEEKWTKERLLWFFNNRPVAEWFNRSSPRIKSGEINPEQVDAETALNLMLEEPLLIRRPLIQVGYRGEVGFDTQVIESWIGLTPKDEALQEVSQKLMSQDLQGCAHKHEHHH
ncbi:ArsC/Spx/MgsR family protein [Rivularia sp. UHCC 0363]|uniref:ArsC/Spx/MgsR family protein n=1 Tax=Rivularia sp. UHCC 0363 TaxID=3110244 RepID=UPI002B1EF900|nr:ArsC/Spx/MgsR family protein [Rivularia sp. UHCC 0363]MEA5593201.1 ArsC/Spx/MgsR family protein [Rivularia sp. UHCC 0363]